jgi:hypothetical protein
LQREEAPVTPRKVGGIHHEFTTATSVDREHAAQQKRDSLVHSRRQQAADRVLAYAIEPERYAQESRSATKQALDQHLEMRSAAKEEVKQVVASKVAWEK